MRQVTPRRWLQLAAVVATALASYATSMPPLQPRRAFPTWLIVGDGERQTSRYASLKTFIVRSGKQGLGLTFIVRARSDTAAQAMTAQLRIGGQMVAGGTARLPALAAQASAETYVALVFDNQGLWNRHALAGTLELTLHDEQQTLRLPVEHHLDGAHRTDLTRSYPLAHDRTIADGVSLRLERRTRGRDIRIWLQLQTTRPRHLLVLSAKIVIPGAAALRARIADQTGLFVGSTHRLHPGQPLTLAFDFAGLGDAPIGRRRELELELVIDGRKLAPLRFLVA